jgi:hypothetical protein
MVYQRNKSYKNQPKAKFYNVNDDDLSPLWNWLELHNQNIEQNSMEALKPELKKIVKAYAAKASEKQQGFVEVLNQYDSELKEAGMALQKAEHLLRDYH